MEPGAQSSSQDWVSHRERLSARGGGGVGVGVGGVQAWRRISREASRGLGHSKVWDQALPINHPLPSIPSGGEGFEGVSSGMEQPGLKVKMSPAAPFAHPALSSGSQVGVVLPAVCPPHRSVLSGSPKVGKAEESSQKPPEAGYLETIPSRKEEAARMGGS